MTRLSIAMPQRTMTLWLASLSRPATGPGVPPRAVHPWLSLSLRHSCRAFTVS